MEGLNIRTDLHLCYLITPYNEILCRDWQKCYDVIVRLQVSAGREAHIAQQCQQAFRCMLGHTGNALLSQQLRRPESLHALRRGCYQCPVMAILKRLTMFTRFFRAGVAA